MSSSIPLSGILKFHSDRDPGRAALTQDGVTISRMELDERSNQRARLLADYGVKEGDTVLLSIPNSILFFEYTFAIWKLGAVPCPVSPKMPDQELQAIVELADPSLIVGKPVGSTPRIDANLPVDSQSKRALPCSVSPRWKILTSGGSTGRPKLIATRAEARFPAEGVGYLGQTSGCTALSAGPLYHNASFSAAHHCLFGGGHVVSMGRFDAEQALQQIERHRVEHMVVVPTMMSRIARLPAEVREGYDVSTIQRVVHLGAACPKWLKKFWIDWLGPEKILEVYAGTEGIGSTAIRGDEWLERQGSVGRPTSGVTIRVVDEAGVECQPGEVGEIQFWIGDKSKLGFEYIGAELKLAAGWVSLGDLGYLDEDGFLYISDRRTDMIVTGGVNIFPAEIEAELDKYPAVKSSVVIGLPDEDLGNRAHAIIQLEDGAAAPSPGVLIDFLRASLAGFKIPRSLEFTDEDLRDEAGKVRRSQLRARRLSKLQAADDDQTLSTHA